MNLEDYIKYDILTLIKDNIDVYMNNDNYFKKMKQYIAENCEKENIRLTLSYELIVELTKEILTDLLSVPHLYDYLDRDLPF